MDLRASLDHDQSSNQLSFQLPVAFVEGPEGHTVCFLLQTNSVLSPLTILSVLLLWAQEEPSCSPPSISGRLEMDTHLGDTSTTLSPCHGATETSPRPPQSQGLGGRRRVQSSAFSRDGHPKFNGRNALQCSMGGCGVCSVQLFSTPWTGAHQASLSMEFSRQGTCRALPFPSPGGTTIPD